MHAPGVWRGGEVEKRDWMFQAAATICEPGDWCWVLDADEVVTHLPADWPAPLADTDALVAAPTLYQPQHNTTGVAEVVSVDPTSTSQPATLFRWPSVGRLTIQGNHATYRTHSVDPRDPVAFGGLTLRGKPNDDYPAVFETLMLPGVRVEHRRTSRALYRRDNQHAYYQRRDTLGLEESLFE